MDHPIPARRPDLVLTRKKNELVEFVVPKNHKLNLEKSKKKKKKKKEKNRQILRTCQKAEKAVKHEGDSDTNSN